MTRNNISHFFHFGKGKLQILKNNIFTNRKWRGYLAGSSLYVQDMYKILPYMVGGI